MNVEVINTGTEILLGSITNTHLAFLAQRLFPLGLRVERQVTVPDGPAIREALSEAFQRAEIVLVTGGLGPTTDDVTREITAELLGLELIYNEGIMQAIADRFSKRGIQLTERIDRQARVPAGATILPNPNGTAPGLYFQIDLSLHVKARHLFLLPGPPRELKPMFDDFAVPILKGLIPTGTVPECHIYRLVGIGESTVEKAVGADLLAIEGLELGYCARSGEVDLRVIGSSNIVKQADEIIKARLTAYIASTGNESLEQVLVSLLLKNKRTLSVAESCTGGFLASRVTNVSGSSSVFVEGFVTYANEAKTRALEIDPGLISTHGAVSEPVARAMAENSLRIAGTDYALSTTGIAGPTGGTDQKPVGTVFIGMAAKDADTVVQKHFFPTDRENFKWLVTQTAMDMLRRKLRQV